MTSSWRRANRNRPAPATTHLLLLVSANVIFGLMTQALPRPIEFVVSGMVTIAFASFGTCATSVFYLSSRSQDDRFDVTVLAEELGIETPSQVVDPPENSTGTCPE